MANNKIIRVGTDGSVTYHAWPEGSREEQNQLIRELIGSDWFEHVMPKHLYEDWGITTELTTENAGKVVSMLVDEEGLLKNLPINPVASWLYGSHEHGSPIVGNVVFVGEFYENCGISFCGIEEMTFRFLCKKMETVSEKINAMKG